MNSWVEWMQHQATFVRWLYEWISQGGVDTGTSAQCVSSQGRVQKTRLGGNVQDLHRRFHSMWQSPCLIE